MPAHDARVKEAERGAVARFRYGKGRSSGLGSPSHAHICSVRRFEGTGKLEYSTRDAVAVMRCTGIVLQTARYMIMESTRSVKYAIFIKGYLI